MRLLITEISEPVSNFNLADFFFGLDGLKFSVLLDTGDVDSYHSGCYGWSLVKFLRSKRHEMAVAKTAYSERYVPEEGDRATNVTERA